MQSSPKPNRVLTVFSLVMINIIAIDSLRNLPTNAAAGLPIISFYLLGALCFLLPCALITAELATRFPQTGGAYVWVREAFGKQWAFISIWLQWIYNVVWYPTILVFIAANLGFLIAPQWANNKVYMLSMVIGLFSLATLGNFFGMKISSAVSSFSAIVGTLIPMIIMIILGVDWLWGQHNLAIAFHTQAFIPSLSHNNNLALISVVLFSLMGLEMSSVHAQEVKNPKKDYPKALTYSSLIIPTTMILATLTIVMIVPTKTLSIVNGMNQALQTITNALHVHWLLPMIIIMIIIGSFGGMAAWVIGPTKALMIAADDGTLPKFMGRTNRFGAPTGTLTVQFFLVLTISCLYLFYPHISTAYWILSDITAQLALLFYIILFISAIKLRYTQRHSQGTYRIPGKRNAGMWITATVAIAVCVTVMLLGFIRPEAIPTGNVFIYELFLIGGTVVFAFSPLLVILIKKTSQKKAA